ncbi:MAG: purine-nucleoside phosphorylase [Rikenellaceae bacterium]|nr:purine-nucleoside phosphorylase [Rikenellaceae bacterium]
MLKRITNIESFIRSKMPFVPEVGIILGTGLGGFTDVIEDKTVIDYCDIPEFPVSTVEGHDGKLIFGTVSGKKVMAMKGRFHYYEGYSAQEVTLPVRVMSRLGIEYLFVSNAAGGINPEFFIGDLMVITDHINLIPNPLIGKNLDQFGVRFPPMNNAYDKELILKAERIGEELNLRLRYGCYVGTTGPSLETPKEYRYFNIIGGDAVGMSTTPEVIVANHCGMKVFGTSVITNSGLTDAASTHEEIQAEGAKAQEKMVMLFAKLLKSL